MMQIVAQEKEKIYSLNYAILISKDKVLYLSLYYNYI